LSDGKAIGIKNLNIGINMKKLLLASLISGAAFTANADVVTFDDSSFTGNPGSTVVFDLIDFDEDNAQVTQTDTDGSGNILGTEDFSEMGSTDIVNFKLGGTQLGVDPSYEVFFNYNFSGTATFNGVTGQIDVMFDTGNSGLYVDTNVNGSFDGGTQVASFGVVGGGCTIQTQGFTPNTGGCGLLLDINFAANYFYNKDGADLSAVPGKKRATLIVTVQDILGLDFNYDQAFGSQTFEINHDGNMKMSVPEPASIAILGLGLLGLAGARRRA
jgi:hypothetical protein